MDTTPTFFDSKGNLIREGDLVAVDQLNGPPRLATVMRISINPNEVQVRFHDGTLSGLMPFQGVNRHSPSPQKHTDIRDGYGAKLEPKPVPTQEFYLMRFEALAKEMLDITKRKNSDYASGNDAFQNFRMVEEIGLTSVEVGILTRMSDKFQRICNLMKREAKVADESVRDTLLDLAIYSLILSIYLETK